MKISKYLVSAAMGLMIMASCNNEGIDDLTGKYPAPAEYKVTNVVKSDRVKTPEGLRIFTLQLSDGSNPLQLQLVGGMYYLESGSYNVMAAPMKGAIVANQSSFQGKNLESGSLDIVNNNGSYTMNGNIWMTDGSVAHINAAVNIAYENDLEKTTLTKVISASKAQDGSNVTLMLAEEGVDASFSFETFSWVVSGNGKYVNIVLPGDAVVSGTYTPAANGAAGAGNYVAGYDDMTWAEYGFINYNQGTCVFNVVNGVAAGEKISTSPISITQDGDTYSIEYKDESLWFIYQGPIAIF